MVSSRAGYSPIIVRLIAAGALVVAAVGAGSDADVNDPEPLQFSFDPDGARSGGLGLAKTSVYDGDIPEKRHLPWYLLASGRKPVEVEESRRARAEKRAPLEIVTFPCYRKSDAVCLNGGRGPKVMRKGKGMFVCVCMCPFGYAEPRCERSWWHE